MATPEPPDFAEVPNPACYPPYPYNTLGKSIPIVPPPMHDPNAVSNPMKYVPSAANPESSFDKNGMFRGPRVSVSRTEGGTTVVTTDASTAPSWFKHVEVRQVNNGWEIMRGRDGFPDSYDWDRWVFTSKADLAKFIVDKF